MQASLPSSSLNQPFNPAGPRTISPFVMVIFGATGDLTARKLMPALYSLLSQKILPDRFFVVGFARRDLTHDQFREMMREALVKHHPHKEIDPVVWNTLSKNLYYQQGFFEERTPYDKLVDLLKTFDDELGACITRFFYLATPPQNYSSILTHLDKSELAEGCGQGSSKWTRILIEKPFGKDLENARKLEEQLAATFEDRQIYRIDHYLAKETIQNIIVFRFGNRPIEAVWNREHIDHIQITLAESGGIGGRGKFYEGIGALRDVAQNHLMAMLAYTAMEEPASFSALEMRRERIRVLDQIKCIEPEQVEQMVVRGQYGQGECGGKAVTGYRQEKEVDPESYTDTFVAFKMFINNDRWKDVPFYLRTGKRMKNSVVQIDVQFKTPESKLFRKFHHAENHANILSIRVQPREGISFRFFAKQPGFTYQLEPVNMDFSYSQSFKKDIMDSYEKILIDSMVGDQTLFASSSGFHATWDFVTKIIQGWDKKPPKFPNYAAGTWGPEEANKLMQKDGRHWIIH